MAWAKEAVAAEHREQRKIRTAATRSAVLEAVTQAERGLCENPGRSLAPA